MTTHRVNFFAIFLRPVYHFSSRNCQFLSIIIRQISTICCHRHSKLQGPHKSWFTSGLLKAFSIWKPGWWDATSRVAAVGEAAGH